MRGVPLLKKKVNIREPLTSKRGKGKFHVDHGVNHFLLDRNPVIYSKEKPKKLYSYVVPDLTDFKLAPYVSSSVPPLNTEEITAKFLLQEVINHLSTTKKK